jgi:hypothetical protein
MVINLRNIFLSIVLIGLLYTPINGIFEVYNLLFGEVKGTSVSEAPIYVKAFKDIIFSLLLLICSISFFSNSLRLSTFIVFLLFFFILSISVINSSYNEYVYFFSGYRWVATFLLSFLCTRFVDEKILFSCSKVLIKVFIIHFTIQMLQFLFLKSAFYGLNGLGLSLRNPGFFFIPNTAGFFTVFVMYFALYFSDMASKSKIIVIAFISAYLTASGTALVAWFAIAFIWYVPRQYIRVSIVPIAILVLFFFLALGVITGRGSSYIALSFGVRFDIFLDLLLNSSLISNTFGYGTSTAYLMGVDAISTDSTFAGLIVNIGLSGFLLVFIILIILGLSGWINQSKPLLSYVIIIIMYMSTTSISEAYPMSLLTALSLGYFMKYGISKNNT